MKKVLIFFLVTVMMLGFFTQTAMAADAIPKFSEKFFPSGKVDVPEDIYYEINKDDSGRTENVYIWLTQPEDVINMFDEWNYLGRDEFEKKYDCTIERHYLQIDCKVDDGEWHYMPEWDLGEYPQENQPYDLAIRQQIVASEDKKTYREGCALIDPWYAQDDENAGYLKPIVYSKDDRWYLDLNNHSLTLRLRYFILCTNWNMTDAEMEDNGGTNEVVFLSDWSEEIVIGKNATQKELVYPEAIEAPVISELTFVESVEVENVNADTMWKLYVDYPQSVEEAAKYYSVEMDAFEPLCAVMQYRVQKDGEWGEWKDTDWGNPTWIYSGWKNFVTEEVSKDDTIEFRAYLRNNAEEGKDSPYTNSLFCNAGDARQEKPDQNGRNTQNTQEGKLEEEPAEKIKCKVCGICPFQPLGICLFIWLAAILIVVIVIFVFIAKGKKKNNEKKR